jgi:hypothetical protein
MRFDKPLIKQFIISMELEQQVQFFKSLIGQELTIFGISEMAFTNENVITVLEVKTGKDYYGEHIKLIYKPPRKRTFFAQKIDKGSMIFKGKTPFCADTSDRIEPISRGTGFTSKVYHGNACLNLVDLNEPASVEAMRKYIDEKQINPIFTEKDRIVYWTTENMQDENDNCTVLYPELESDNAVIRRYKETGS